MEEIIVLGSNETEATLNNLGELHKYILAEWDDDFKDNAAKVVEELMVSVSKASAKYPQDGHYITN